MRGKSDPEKTDCSAKKIKISSIGKQKRHYVQHWHIIAFFLMLYDVLAVNGAYFIALWMRYDFKYSAIPLEYISAWLKFVPVYTIFCILVFYILRLYRSVWRFASYTELLRVFASSLVTAVFHGVGITLLFGQMPLFYYFIGAILQFIMILGIRFSYRLLLLVRTRRAREQNEAKASRVMMVGAGSAGQMLMRDLHSAKETNERVCCIIDDNANKWGRYIDGVPIVGGREKILSSVKKYKIEKIYLAIPSATASEQSKILNICNETNCELKRLPGMYQLVNGEVRVSALRQVKIDDLLGREPVQVNLDEIFAFLSGKVILVTGGGGSIGSELCRQIAKHNPKKLIIFDIYENSAYSIGLELKDMYPDLDLEILIGSVRDSGRVNYIFNKYKPDVVYHAAAHKHVPLMEYSPCEAIKNNVIGTYKTAYAAMMNGCRRFVLISTDKAVNPTGIMGASKRICEMIIQSFDHKIKERKINELPILHMRRETGDEFIKDTAGNGEYPHTEFVAVRFGNVLGSNGSVIPRFKKQILNGGPVTVTHPEIMRYFMTIPEAVSLVLEAGTYANSGEIFVLDMGSPIKIDTLARNLIKLSGLKPDVDIKIKYTGLRPGEKLYEEKLMSEEGLRTTPNKLIHIGRPIPFDTDKFLCRIDALMKAAYAEKTGTVLKLLEETVTTYRPAENGADGNNAAAADVKTAPKQKKADAQSADEESPEAAAMM